MKMITTDEAARIIGVSDSMVRRYCRQGVLPASELSGVWVIRESDAKKFRRPPMGRPSSPGRKPNG
jgi:excisionase family DNA binding protein